MKTLLFLLIIAIYIFNAYYFTKLILSSTLLSSIQKKLNIAMILILPLVWGELMHSLLKTKTEGSHNPRNKKERDFNKGYGENHPTD